MKTDPIALAIIGGSGFYSMAEVADANEIHPNTPFGKPSSPIVIGRLDGRRVAFLARHGIGHHITPSEVNYRANIYALKSLGVERIVSISACGSLREDFAPGHIVIPDQIFDHTSLRTRSFFGEGMVAHVGVADPFCPALSQQLAQSVQQTGATLHIGGAIITIEGPRFSTRAESNIYRSWGLSVIGMTTSPEAFLAREAEICYTVMAHVTDYDVWHTTEAPVSVEMVIQVLNQNTAVARQSIRNLVKLLPPDRSCECPQAMSSAIITNAAAIPPAARKKLELLIKKYI